MVTSSSPEIEDKRTGPYPPGLISRALQKGHCQWLTEDTEVSVTSMTEELSGNPSSKLVRNGTSKVPEKTIYGQVRHQRKSTINLTKRRIGYRVFLTTIYSRSYHKPLAIWEFVKQANQNLEEKPLPLTLSFQCPLLKKKFSIVPGSKEHLQNPFLLSQIRQ